MAVRVASIKRDIFNEAGDLLYERGLKLELTEQTIAKLLEQGVLKQVLAQVEEDSTQEVYGEIIKELAQKSNIKTTSELGKQFKGLSPQAIAKASAIVDSVVTAGDEYSWNRFISLLLSYVDWLYAHSLNTALISCTIASGLGYTNRQLVEVAIGALFHDIGLTLLPRETLNKPSKLTDVEYAMIKNHCEMGHSMLLSVDLPEISKSIILQHHEKSDGTGYPYRLKGADIHEASMITMIAEYFDTATTDRSYKKAQPVHEVIEIMRKDSHIFPPHIVNVLAQFVM